MKLANIPTSNKQFEQVCDLVERSYPGSCVLWINKIENESLELRYNDAKKNILNKRGKVDEHLLFHGTREANIKQIASEGFCASKNSRSYFGKGTYLAAEAMYSKDFADVAIDGVSHMFVCKTLIGRPVIGIPGMVIDIENYDCAVDNLMKPRIYVIPNDACILPEYIVAFHKSAK